MIHSEFSLKVVALDVLTGAGRVFNWYQISGVVVNVCHYSHSLTHSVGQLTAVSDLMRLTKLPPAKSEWSFKPGLYC